MASCSKLFSKIWAASCNAWSRSPPDNLIIHDSHALLYCAHEPLKCLLLGLRFFCILEKSRNNQATDLAVSQLRGSTIAKISSYVPGQHVLASAGPGPSSSSPKQWKSGGSVKIYNFVSTRSLLTKSKKKNLSRAKQYEKRACQSTDGLTQNGLGTAERFITDHKSNPSRPTHCESHSPLSHWFVSIARKNRYMTHRVSPPATDFFGYRTVVLGLFKFNIKARYEIREFLNANLWLIHLIAFEIDWRQFGVKMF